MIDSTENDNTLYYQRTRYSRTISVLTGQTRTHFRTTQSLIFPIYHSISDVNYNSTISNQIQDEEKTCIKKIQNFIAKDSIIAINKLALSCCLLLIMINVLFFLIDHDDVKFKKIMIIDGSLCLAFLSLILYGQKQKENLLRNDSNSLNLSNSSIEINDAFNNNPQGRLSNIAFIESVASERTSRNQLDSIRNISFH